MNREIKFRVWHKEMKYMSPVGQLNEMKSVLIYVPEQIDEDGNVDWNGDIVEMEKVELMQYTGLKDKNGVEIYEGDIVFSHFDIGMGGELGTRTEVAWQGAGWALITNKGVEGDLAEHYFRCEVIGNIYQHKELLN